MAAKTRDCPNCGGGAFQVHEDGRLVCENCGTVSEPSRKTYNRAVKHESGEANSVWNGLATFLLFEHVTGGCFGIVFLLIFLTVGGGALYWFTGRDRPNRKPAAEKKTEKPELTDEQKQARTLQWVGMAADRVQKETRSIGRILHKDEAHRAMFPRNDAWDTPLLYEVVDDDTIRIRSAGKDRKPETEDDLVETRKISRPAEKTEKTPAKTRGG